jgi:hypothetical protein
VILVDIALQMKHIHLKEILELGKNWKVEELNHVLEQLMLQVQ